MRSAPLRRHQPEVASAHRSVTAPRAKSEIRFGCSIRANPKVNWLQTGRPINRRSVSWTAYRNLHPRRPVPARLVIGLELKYQLNAAIRRQIRACEAPSGSGRPALSRPEARLRCQLWPECRQSGITIGLSKPLFDSSEYPDDAVPQMPATATVHPRFDRRGSRLSNPGRVSMLRDSATKIRLRISI